MPQETMTPRERWEAVLRHETPDRLPMDYWGTSEAGQKLIAHLGLESMAQVHEQLHIDVLTTVGPRYAGPPIPEGQDVHGCRHRNVEYDGGTYSECVHRPLAEFASVEEIEASYTWPSVDWWDFSVHSIPANRSGFYTGVVVDPATGLPTVSFQDLTRGAAITFSGAFQ